MSGPVAGSAGLGSKQKRWSSNRGFLLLTSGGLLRGVGVYWSSDRWQQVAQRHEAGAREG
jgi:hypothetical protein